MIQRNAIPMNLQLFAESDGDGDVKSEPTTVKATTLDELLADPKQQSEFDKRITKALETARGKWEVEAAKQIEEAKTEAERLATMNTKQKALYETEKRERELAEREASIIRRELKAEAKNALADKGLPLQLADADILNYNDADSCKASIETVSKAFQEAVQGAVNKRLKGGRTMTRAPQGDTPTKEDYAKMGYSERLKLKTKQPEAYKELSGK